jgi:putative ABC transport system permease protein
VSPVRVKRPTLLREVGKNLRRRKLRSFLTLAGIGLGAFALTVMGALAENFNTSIGSLREFLEDQVLVRPKGSNVFFSTGHLPVSLLDPLEKVAGVDVVVPRVTVFFEEAQGANFGPPEQIFGVDIARARRSPLFDLKLAAGRKLEPGERGKIVLGSRLAQKYKVGTRYATAGDRVLVRKHEFEIVGVGAATGTPVDSFAVASIDDTRQIAKEADPALDVASSVDEFSVYPKEDVDPNDLADVIKKTAPDALIFPPATAADQLRSLTAIWNSIILGSALVALLVGGVAIINTMIFSVTERTREIGTKKAIGASSRDILREFLSESALLSFAGGIGGGLFGLLFTKALNAASRNKGVIAFTVTPRLAIFVFALSLLIGVGAGLLPARRAARIDPVRALRTLG